MATNTKKNNEDDKLEKIITILNKILEEVIKLDKDKALTSEKIFPNK